MTNYPQENIKTVSMLEFIIKNIKEITNEEELNKIKQEIQKQLYKLDQLKPYYREKIPVYLLDCTYPYDKTAKHYWYDDVWYYAAKDGMMGKQIYSPKDIPEDATHIVEIHK